MTTYKELFGKAVKYLSSDPANEAEGQVWYNSTSGTFKTVVTGAAWSSSGGLGTARYALGKGTTGTQTASIAALGRISTGATGVTEEYNGSGWSTGGTANTARYGAGCFGTQTALVVAAGAPAQQTVEEYNGSSWTTVTSIPSTARSYLAGFGVETAGAVFGGGSATPVDTVFTTTDEYNGSSWTAGGNLNTGRNRIASTGTLTAGIAATGAVLPFNTASGVAEEYNGTAWTNVTSVNTPRYNVAGFGIQTATVIAGGTPSNTTTETWDGSSWATSPATLGTGTAAHSAGGDSGTAGLVFGGNPPGISNTEEYNFSASVIIPAAWASGGNLSTARAAAGDCGIQTAGLIVNGGIGTAPYTSNATEEYDGSTWTSGGNTPFLSSDLSAAGTQTAALGFASGDSPTTAVITYDGSTWTTSPATYPPQSPGSQHRGIGTQTAAISVGMGTGSLNWDGSSWASGPSTNTPRNGQKPAGWGTQTSAIVATGFQNPTTLTSNSESFNGTSFTEEGLVLTAVRRVGGTTSASGSDGFFTGGSTAAGAFTYTTQTQAWDGTVWYTSANLANARLNHMGFGTNNSAAVTGGQLSTGITNTTEEFTGETSAFNYKTITTS